MDFLARREHSFFELKQKLLIKYPELVINDLEEALSQLQQEKLQSDERFSESFIRYRKSRGFGYRHIRADLSSRRVHPDIISNHLYIDDDDWTEIAQRLIDKKLGDSKQLEFGGKQHRKLLRFFESRGFSSNEIQHILAKSVKFLSIEGK